MIHFRNYVMHYANAPETPVGDFIRDARSDHTFPTEIDTWDQLENYLFTRHACFDAKQAARQCWRNYHRWLGRNWTGKPWREQRGANNAP